MTGGARDVLAVSLGESVCYCCDTHDKIIAPQLKDLLDRDIRFNLSLFRFPEEVSLMPQVCHVFARLGLPKVGDALVDFLRYLAPISLTAAIQGACFSFWIGRFINEAQSSPLVVYPRSVSPFHVLEYWYQFVLMNCQWQEEGSTEREQKLASSKAQKMSYLTPWWLKLSLQIPC